MTVCTANNFSHHRLDEFAADLKAGHTSSARPFNDKSRGISNRKHAIESGVFDMTFPLRYRLMCQYGFMLPYYSLITILVLLLNIIFVTLNICTVKIYYYISNFDISVIIIFITITIIIVVTTVTGAFII